MDISPKLWKVMAKHYRAFYNMTLEQAREWQGKYFKAKELNKKLADALMAFDECPYRVDWASVPKAGIDSAPEQVVVNMSVSWSKIVEMQNAIRALKSPAKD